MSWGVIARVSNPGGAGTGPEDGNTTGATASDMLFASVGTEVPAIGFRAALPISGVEATGAPGADVTDDVAERICQPSPDGGATWDWSRSTAPHEKDVTLASATAAKTCVIRDA